MFKIFKPKKGSVLVFSLIVLSILLSAAVAVATVSVSNRKSTQSTDKSNQSFQVANSGVELVLRQIYKTVPTHATLNDLATALSGGAACAGGSVTKTGVAGGDVKVSFYDKDDNLISCADTSWRSKVVGVKSEGTAFGTTRLVETAVAAGSDFGWTPIDAGAVRTHNAGEPANVWYGLYLPSALNRSPSAQCVRAGFLYATGICKITAFTWTREGAILSGNDPVTNNAYIGCEYWNDYVDIGSMQILCAK